MNRYKGQLHRIEAPIAVVLYVILCVSLKTGNISGFDNPVRFFFYSLRNDELTVFAKIITYMGNWQTIVILCLVLLIVPVTRIKYGIPVAASAIIVSIINKCIKHIVQRPRPEDVVHLVNEGGFSFTSGHSITSMMVYGLLICLIYRYVNKKTASVALMCVLTLPMILVGISRIYLGVHYPSDVLGGWLLGIIGICVVKEVYYRKDNKNPA